MSSFRLARMPFARSPRLLDRGPSLRGTKFLAKAALKARF